MDIYSVLHHLFACWCRVSAASSFIIFFLSSSFHLLPLSSSFHLLLLSSSFHLLLIAFLSSSSFHLLLSSFSFQLSSISRPSFMACWLILFISVLRMGRFAFIVAPYPSFLCLRAVIDENLRFRGKKCCCRGMKESVSPLLSICGVLFCHDAKLRIMQRVCNSCRSVVVQVLALVFVSGLLSDRYKFCDFCFLNCDFCARLVETLV